MDTTKTVPETLIEIAEAIAANDNFPNPHTIDIQYGVRLSYVFLHSADRDDVERTFRFFRENGKSFAASVRGEHATFSAKIGDVTVHGLYQVPDGLPTPRPSIAENGKAFLAAVLA